MLNNKNLSNAFWEALNFVGKTPASTINALCEGSAVFDGEGEELPPESKEVRIECHFPIKKRMPPADQTKE